MKLLDRNHDGCTFLLGKKERRILLELLRRYPLTTATHQLERSKALEIQPHGDPALLRETLDQSRSQVRSELQTFLNEEERWSEDELGLRLSLTPEQVEIVLQALNDVRVGSWTRLGSPDDQHAPPLLLTADNIELAWAMDMAGHFQMQFLAAHDPA